MRTVILQKYLPDDLAITPKVAACIVVPLCLLAIAAIVILIGLS